MNSDFVKGKQANTLILRKASTNQRNKNRTRNLNEWTFTYLYPTEMKAHEQKVDIS